MKYVICAVYDSSAECFGRPIFVSAIGAAVRSLVDEVNRNDPSNQMYAHSRDFTLFHCGSFDDATGRFETLDVPSKVCDAQSLKHVNGSNDNGVS